MAVRPIDAWFAEYGESHQHPTNTLIHWICVPAIYFSIVGLLMAIPAPRTSFLPGWLWAYLATIGVLLFYLKRSRTLAFAMMIWTLACVALAAWIDRKAPWPLWAICVSVFALAWAGQFYGHHVEGRKPSFLKDLQFLLIGPAWLMAKLLRRWGIAY